MIPISTLSSINLSTLADDCIILQTKEDVSKQAAPVWLEDAKAAECMQCKVPFSLFNRRQYGYICKICVI